MKKSRDYDNTFQTIKKNHKRLLIAIINDVFHKDYPMDTAIEMLPAKSDLFTRNTDGSVSFEERESDAILRIGSDYYILEVQAYDDDSMAIRIAEYTFLAARNLALGDQGHAHLKIPRYTIIYIKPSAKTPRTTQITYSFPDGQEVTCEERNIFLSDLSREEIIEKKLYAYIPFYIARYEKELSTEKNYQKAVEDLVFFRDKMIELHQRNELTGEELTNLKLFVNTIVEHITDGNKIEKEMMGIMGGTAYETDVDRVKREVAEEYADRMAEADKALAEKDKALAEKDRRIAELEALIASKA